MRFTFAHALRVCAVVALSCGLIRQSPNAIALQSQKQYQVYLPFTSYSSSVFVQWLHIYNYHTRGGQVTGVGGYIVSLKSEILCNIKVTFIWDHYIEQDVIPLVIPTLYSDLIVFPNTPYKFGVYTLSYGQRWHYDLPDRYIVESEVCAKKYIKLPIQITKIHNPHKATFKITNPTDSKVVNPTAKIIAENGFSSDAYHPSAPFTYNLNIPFSDPNNPVIRPNQTIEFTYDFNCYFLFADEICPDANGNDIFKDGNLTLPPTAQGELKP